MIGYTKYVVIINDHMFLSSYLSQVFLILHIY